MDNPYTMMNCHIVSFAKALAEFKLNTPKGTYEGVGLGGLVQTLEGYALELQNRLSVIADFHSFLVRNQRGCQIILCLTSISTRNSTEWVLGSQKRPNYREGRLSQVLLKFTCGFFLAYLNFYRIKRVLRHTLYFPSSLIYRSSPGASRNLQFAQSLIQIAKEDNVASFTEAVMRDVLSKPLWASHPDLIYLTINHSAVMNKVCVKFV